MRIANMMVTAAALALVVPDGADAQQPTRAAATPTAMPGPEPDYRRPDHWLCRPGSMQHCTANLDATVIAADGRLSIAHWKAAEAPPIDCFYVYPTASQDPASNSDLIPGTKPLEEIPQVQNQFARFAGVCRLFAPMYRSSTVTAMRGQAPAADPAMRYRDVAAAWTHYLANDNHGRGVVLIGHSQGAFLLGELIQKEIDGKPAQARLVSALLLGGAVSVPPGKTVGGDFKSIPLCTSGTQAGCIIAYNSRRAGTPLPANAILGRAPEGLQEACVNPAAPAGGETPLDAYLQTAWPVAGGTPAPQKPWTTPEQPIATDYVQVPGMLTGECVTDGRGSWFAVTVHGDPADPRVDEIKGDVEPAGKPLPEWGLHMIDVNVVQGDLIRLIEQQGKIWAANAPKP